MSRLWAGVGENSRSGTLSQGISDKNDLKQLGGEILDQNCPIEHTSKLKRSAVLWPLITWNVASAAGKQNFQFHWILIELVFI